MELVGAHDPLDDAKENEQLALRRLQSAAEVSLSCEFHDPDLYEICKNNQQTALEPCNYESPARDVCRTNNIRCNVRNVRNACKKYATKATKATNAKSSLSNKCS